MPKGVPAPERKYSAGCYEAPGANAPADQQRGPANVMKADFKNGDWFCLQCGNHNFASR